MKLKNTEDIKRKETYFLVNLLCRNQEEGVKQLYRQLSLEKLTTDTPQQQMKNLYKDLNLLREELYNKALNTFHTSPELQTRATKLEQLARELKHILEPLQFSNLTEPSKRGAALRKTRTLSEELSRQRTLFAYTRLRNRYDSQNTETLHSLKQKVLAWCDRNIEPVNIQTHFVALNDYVQDKPDRKQTLKATLVLLEADRDTLGLVTNTDMYIQTVTSLHDRTLLVLTSEKTVLYLERKLHRRLDRIDLKVLQNSVETLNAALKLYTENPGITYEKHVEIAALI